MGRESGGVEGGDEEGEEGDSLLDTRRSLETTSVEIRRDIYQRFVLYLETSSS